MNDSISFDHSNGSPLQRLAYGFAKKSGVLLDGSNAMLYLCGLPSFSLLSEVRRVALQPLTLEMVDESRFERLLAEHYQNNSSQARQLMENLGSEMDFYTLASEFRDDEDLLEADGDAPIIRLLNAMLGEAIKEEASDIHIETFEKSLSIRFRIDGVLREILRPNRQLAVLLTARVKVMAKLDIAEKRLPQDGRISLRIAGRSVDLRVSTMPSSFGERVVLRLLDKQQARIDMSTLGMNADNHQQLVSLLNRPHGILLVTGPTGSGKSTTLYAGIQTINSRERNILTVEDPVEYNIDGIGQTQVNTKVDMTFARGLRAILRQDPDVVMIGEIRDLETAQIAVQASLTGHLVLSTLHTNTAIGAITRLRDMGIEPFLLSSSLLGVLAQRLVRVLCPHCRTAHKLTKKECHLLHLDVDKYHHHPIYRPNGCEHCNQSGYKGRTGIYELVTVDDTLRGLIHEGASEQAMLAQARLTAPAILKDGAQKILDGTTSLAEVLRVTHEEH
ncbi:type II secretion system ATPase GspE [Celerinatantimonas yamalensis]|uniref:Type II secretion system protein E n=1 Tax=Celerinatantimonas yamalensis TaxID=559956 RepID=A0ABW9G8Q4_9GAMM